MKYNASLDKTTRIITVAITVLFVGISVFEFLTFSGGARAGAYISTAILVAVYGFAYFYRPVAYTLTDHHLTIHRPIGDLTYTRGTFEDVRTIPREDLKFTIRTFGVGGFWGYFGQFYNAVYGKMIWYVTRRDHLVLIKIKGKRTVLISPDNIDAFMEGVGSKEHMDS
ncbi:PH domain-containing protein [Dyadobacter sp. 676]|uniref:PH domain-containing protein n=1 Tax=Dyadobacter sp. 676 TaxID=3088362 RepID=A0AAU8FPY7_9BACT